MSFTIILHEFCEFSLCVFILHGLLLFSFAGCLWHLHRLPTCFSTGCLLHELSLLLSLPRLILSPSTICAHVIFFTFLLVGFAPLPAFVILGCLRTVCLLLPLSAASSMVVCVLLYLTVVLWSPAILCSYMYKFVSAVGL